MSVAFPRELYFLPILSLLPQEITLLASIVLRVDLDDDSLIRVGARSGETTLAARTRFDQFKATCSINGEVKNPFMSNELPEPRLIKIFAAVLLEVDFDTQVDWDNAAKESNLPNATEAHFLACHVRRVIQYLHEGGEMIFVELPQISSDDTPKLRNVWSVTSRIGEEGNAQPVEEASPQPFEENNYASTDRSDTHSQTDEEENVNTATRPSQDIDLRFQPRSTIVETERTVL